MSRKERGDLWGGESGGVGGGVARVGVVLEELVEAAREARGEPTEGGSVGDGEAIEELDGILWESMQVLKVDRVLYGEDRGESDGAGSERSH